MVSIPDYIHVTDSVNIALLIFRLTLGGMIFMHGYNHLFGAGGVEGTARWFKSLGFEPAKVHALMSGLVELAVSVGLVFGFLDAIACAALIGTMIVAGVAAHRPNGFFIFRDGYEYVLIVAVAALLEATIGPGTFSLDQAFGIVDYSPDTFGSDGLIGIQGFLIALIGGIGGGGLLLGTGWRPSRVPKKDPAA